MCEKLFKNNIPFYSSRNEYISEYNFTTDTTLNISYKTNTIHQPIKDLMYKINPFIYYLASKYQNIKQWSQEYEIRFDIGVAFSIEEYV